MQKTQKVGFFERFGLGIKGESILSRNASLFIFGVAFLWISYFTLKLIEVSDVANIGQMLLPTLVMPTILAVITLVISMMTIDREKLKKRRFGGYWKVALTGNRFGKWLIKQRWFQFVLEFPNAVFFVMVMIFGIYGYGGYIQAADAGFVNGATFLTWNVWWTGIIITFFVAGRFWCTICPLGCIGEWAHRTRAPPPVTKQNPLIFLSRVVLALFFGFVSLLIAGVTIGLFAGYSADSLLGTGTLSDNLVQALIDYTVFILNVPINLLQFELNVLLSGNPTDFLFAFFWLGATIFGLLLGLIFGYVLPEFTYASVIGTPLQQKQDPRRPYPKKLRSLWITTFLFAGIMMFDFAVGMFVNPLYTALFIVLLIALSIILGLIYERRAFCMYVCPLGGLIGVYGMTGMLEIRNRDLNVCKKCRTKDCLKGRTYTEDIDPMTGQPRVINWPSGYACPMGEFPMVMESNLGCIQCTECIKSCPNDNIDLNIRVPLVDTYTVKKHKFDQAGLAAALVGITLAVIMPSIPMVQNLLNQLNTTIQAIPFLPSFVKTFGGIAIWFGFAAFLMPIGLFFIVLYIARQISGIHTKTTKQLFSIFAYSIIPLGLAMHFSFWMVRIFEHAPSTIKVLADPFGGYFMGHRIYTDTGFVILNDPITFPVALLYAFNPLIILGVHTMDMPALVPLEFSFAFRVMAVLAGLAASIYAATRTIVLNLPEVDKSKKNLHFLIPVLIWMVFFTAAGLYSLAAQV